ncbi:DUF11 domain-containing protein [Pedobacter sp. NJ-S-72]
MYLCKFYSSSSGTTYVPATGLWTIGTLANTATSTLTITATVNATGPYANTATIAGTENDPMLANNTSTVTTTPSPRAHLNTVKTLKKKCTNKLCSGAGYRIQN